VRVQQHGRSASLLRSFVLVDRLAEGEGEPDVEVGFEVVVPVRLAGVHIEDRVPLLRKCDVEIVPTEV
jgi:hypothetical protein